MSETGLDDDWPPIEIRALMSLAMMALFGIVFYGDPLAIPRIFVELMQQTMSGPPGWL